MSRELSPSLRDGRCRCQALVQRPHEWHRTQCERAAVVGDYCKQHDPEAVRLRESKTREREDAAFRRRVLEWRATRMYLALLQIAEGHNDPRALAAECIADIPRRDS